MRLPAPEEIDPFELPEWLGEGQVTWSSESGLAAGPLVTGALTDPDGHGPVACDLLAVDEAYPSPVTDDSTRLRAHHAWRHEQVQLTSYDGRLTLLVPGTGFTADLVLDALQRLAKAVGAMPEQYAALLRL